MFICLVCYTPYRQSIDGKTHRFTKTAIPQVAKRASTWAVGRGASPYAFVRSPRGETAGGVLLYWRSIKIG